MQDLTEEIEMIRDIAKCFRRGYEITQIIKQFQTKIVKHKEKTLEKDEQFMREKARS